MVGSLRLVIEVGNDFGRKKHCFCCLHEPLLCRDPLKTHSFDSRVVRSDLLVADWRLQIRLVIGVAQMWLTVRDVHVGTCLSSLSSCHSHPGVDCRKSHLRTCIGLPRKIYRLPWCKIDLIAIVLAPEKAKCRCPGNGGGTSSSYNRFEVFFKPANNVNISVANKLW